ncbi:MAG: hypothetical protein HZB37_05110 [Planctomycetes bacterium]|nr:hypothetical protein [Planctomycetota bacterium]
MKTQEFFVCPHCGNAKIFKVFSANFQVIVQSLETGRRIDESGTLPSLRKADNFIECSSCFQKLDYDAAAYLGNKYISKHQKQATSPAGA